MRCALTGKVWHCLQLLLPELGDLDRLSLSDFAICGHPLLIGVIYDLLQEVGLDSVDDIEEVLAAWTLANSVVIREILGDILILRDLWPQSLNR